MGETEKLYYSKAFAPYDFCHAGLFAIFFEVVMMNTEKINIQKICQLGILAAISIVLVLAVHFPIFQSAPYLEYDMADVPILLAAFTVGPFGGLAVLLVVSLIQAFFLGGNSIIGFIMHFVASGALVLVAGLIFSKYKTTKSMIIGLVLGSLCMTAFIIPLNLIFTPLLGTPVDMVKSIIVPVLIPFNLIKSFGNSIISFLLFIPVNDYLPQLKKD